MNRRGQRCGISTEAGGVGDGRKNRQGWKQLQEKQRDPLK